jgi:uncharacterized protein
MTTPDEAEAMVAAIHAGDIETVRRLIESNPAIATEPLGGRFKTRTPLAAVADWPGYFPNGQQIATLLIQAGADPNFRGADPQPGDETPLHWAASSDDVDVARALIDGGADIEMPGGSIGTPLDNAIGYCCWHVARLLVSRGAKVEKLWHAAALGQLERLEELLAGASEEQINQAFWHACSAAERRAAERLLNAGASLDWSPEYAHGTALDAAKGDGTRRSNVVEWLEHLGARAQDAGE